MFPPSKLPSFEETLWRALEDERRLSEERALIPGLLQHDIANVLCRVSVAAGVLTEGAEGEEKARALRDIEGGVKRMRELFGGIEVLFSARAGAKDFGRNDLVAFITELVHEPGVWPEGAPVTLALPPQMWCDFSPTLMRHTLVNLIGNAIAYSVGTWVRVRLARTCGHGWQISVANGGPGIPIDHLPYLFELGRGLEAKPKVGMPGLGLYLARMCVRAQGARLRLRSRPQLTVFSFGLVSAQRGWSSLGEGGERVPAA